MHQRRSHWYREAYSAVVAALDALPPEKASRADALRLARDAYPFGMRKYWPYKQYLKARRLALAQRFPRWFPMPPTPLPGRAGKNGPDIPGQILMFDEGTPGRDRGRK